MIDTLREKINCSLINNNSIFMKDKNHFGKMKVPLMCDFFKEEEPISLEAYQSGNRSLIFQSSDLLIKAKGIGIPNGYTRPIYNDEHIHTYKLLNDPNMCHKSIIWGFMDEAEFKCELFGVEKAKELGQNINLIGYTSFNDVYCLKMKDRSELFKKLKSTNIMERFKYFKKKSFFSYNSVNKTKAFSIFYSVPSDIRVKELLCTFMFPQIREIINENDIIDFTKWLGTNCSSLLKDFHDNNLLHGTWLDNTNILPGFLDIHSNAYTGNYLVDENGLTMCDFDLTKPVEDEKYKEIEKWSLIHMENPLYYSGSYTPADALNQGIAKKNPFRENLAVIFEQSVDDGYKKELYEVENRWKKEMLNTIINLKTFFWELYNIPKNIIDTIDYIDYLITTKEIDEKEIKNLRNQYNI